MSAQSAPTTRQNPSSRPQQLTVARRTFAGEAWRLLRKNLAALAGLSIIGLFIFAALFAPLLTVYEPSTQDPSMLLSPPGRVHLLGTDRLGRDILSRILFGARVSLTVSLGAMSMALLLGVPIGLVSAYFGGITDDILQRLTDMLMSLPSLVFAIAIVAALGPSLTGTLVAIGISSAPGYVRLTRSMILTLKTRDFVTAARALGIGSSRIIFRHLLPNALGPLIVQSTLGLGSAILMESGLSFLGLGAQPPTPSWGGMVAEGREFLYAGPHLITVPGLFIMITILSFNLLGDGLRDALDPRLRGR